MRTCPRLLAMSVGFSLVCCLACGQDNLLSNPGFEDGEEGQMPTAWQPHGGQTEQLDRYPVEDAHTGKRAMLIIDEVGGERTSEAKAGSGLKQRVEAEAGAWYVASCWGKCVERSGAHVAWLQLRFLPSNEITNLHLDRSQPGGGWARYQVLGQAPEGTTHAEVYLKTLHTGTCRYVVDDFSLALTAMDENDQRMALVALGFAALDEVHQPHLHTLLVADGKPAAHIVVPDDKQWQDVGMRLATEIERRSGAKLAVETKGEQALASDQTTIAIGNLNNNYVAERMWLNRYQTVNALRPGPGEYILQTIPEPHDCPLGKNVLLIGASDLAGAERGVEALLQRLHEGKDLSIDEWILEVSDSKHLDDEAREKLLSKKLSKYWLKDFWAAARKYQDTGDLAYAERAKHILLACAKRYRDYAQDPDLLKHYPAPTGRQFRVYWPEETSSEWIGSMWDFIEECPVFSDEDRFTCTNALLSTCHDLTRHVYYWKTLASPETTEAVAFNHTTFPLLGVYFLARYFERYYGDVDGRMQDYLARCRNCFGAQMASWKPTEDATGYLSIVPRHTMSWSLAERDYSYFESGAVKTLCDYTLGFCDNTGDPASFGDSGYGRGIYTRNLDWAVWYYKDANILWWLQRVTGQRGKPWQNPYDPDLKPEPWDELAGVTAFRLTEALYQWSAGKWQPAPNVPIEKAFDKISFRENLDPGGQFFLLDGYSRGHHLQYDGNAITKFYADGEDWLIDGDYLVRNTTDHNMLSLTRDGRCAEYEPACAALEHLADLPSAAMTQTVVYDYIGANWLRNIFWLKGGPVCVLDHVTAVEPGNFKCECIWKMLDRGERGGDGQRTFSLTRLAGGTPGKHGLTVVKNPAPEVQAAVKFDDRFSRLDFPVELAAGTYGLNAVGYGLNSGADSFWVSIDGGDPIACHLPLEKFGRPYDSGVNPKSGPMPRVVVETGGIHVVTVTLREGPGVMLDRVEFITADGKLAVGIEAESAPDLPEGLVEKQPARVFYLKGDGHSRLEFSTRFNHSRLPIRYAHQKFAATLATGQAISNQTLFYNADEAENASYDLRRIGLDAVLILQDDDPLGVFAADPSALDLPGELATDAALAFFARETIVLCDATRLGSSLRASAPVEIEFDLREGGCVVEAEAATTIQLGGAEQTVEGRHELNIPEEALTALRRAWRSKLAQLGETAQVGTPAEGTERKAEGLTEQWTVEPTYHQEVPQAVLEMVPADLDGDGVDEVLAIRGRYLTCIATTGKVLWEFDGADELYAACAWDIDGDGQLEVFCGGKSKRLYVLDTDGSLLHDHEIETYYRVSRTTIHEPRLDDVLVRDFDGDGDWEAVLGTVDGFTQLIGHNFEQQWIDGETNHGTTEFQAVDLDGDGIEEVAVGNRYGKLRVYDIRTGKLAASLNSELGDVQMAVADLDGDGKPELINGSATGAFKCGHSGREVLWQFPNYGYVFRDLKVADVAPSAGLEVAVASDTEFVYLLSPDGETLAQRDMGSAPLEIALLERGQEMLLAAGCRDGSVYVLDGSLEPRGRCDLGSQVNSVVAAQAADAPLIVAGCANGEVRALRPAG